MRYYVAMGILIGLTAQSLGPLTGLIASIAALVLVLWP